MATNTSFLSLSKPAYSDNVSLSVLNSNMDKIDAAVGQRSRVENILRNSDFRASSVINQRGWASGTMVSIGAYFIDGWVCEAEDAPTINEDGIASAVTIHQRLAREGLVGKTVTAAVGLADGTIVAKSGVVPAWSAWDNFINTSSDGVGLMLTSASLSFLRFRITSNSKKVLWAALYPGAYTNVNVPAYQPKGYAAELLSCQQYFHLYGTSAARPSHGKDCTPHMIADAPTQGTVSINGVTHYYNSADL